jgi:hypothetical protein
MKDALYSGKGEEKIKNGWKRKTDKLKDHGKRLIYYFRQCQEAPDPMWTGGIDASAN